MVDILGRTAVDGELDVNYDGIVNRDDMNIVMSYIMGQVILNSDQISRLGGLTIDMGDVVRMQRFIGGTETRFSPGDYITLGANLAKKTLYLVKFINGNDKYSTYTYIVAGTLITGATTGTTYIPGNGVLATETFMHEDYKSLSIINKDYIKFDPGFTGGEIKLGVIKSDTSGDLAQMTPGMEIAQDQDFTLSLVVSNNSDTGYKGIVYTYFKDPNTFQEQLQPINSDTVDLSTLFQELEVKFGQLYTGNAGTYDIVVMLTSPQMIREVYCFSLIVRDQPSVIMAPGQISYSGITKTFRDNDQLPQDTQITLTPIWTNNSNNLKFTGVAVVSVKFPSINGVQGITQELTIQGGISRTRAPMETANISCQQIALHDPGTYIFTERVFVGGSQIGEFSWSGYIIGGLHGTIQQATYTTNSSLTVKTLMGNTTFDKGTQITPTIKWINDALNRSYVGVISANVVYPDGQVVALTPSSGQTKLVAPLKTSSVSFSSFGLSQVGTTVLRAGLVAEDNALDMVEWALVVNDIPRGRIGMGNVKFSTDNMWRDNSDNLLIPYNNQITLAPIWVNESLNLRFAATLKAMVEYPDGSVKVLSPIDSQTTVIGPLEANLVTFAQFTTTLPGSYHVAVQLFYGTTMLSQLSWMMKAVVMGPDRITLAKKWIDTLYQTDGTYAYLSEYPGVPLAIYVRNTKEWRMIGDVRGDTIRHVTRMGTLRIYPEDDNFDVSFEDRNPVPLTIEDYNCPSINVSREYDKGGIYYTINILGYTGTYTSDLYIGNTLLKSGISKSSVFPIKITVAGTSLPACRYTMRHGSVFGNWISQIWGESTKSSRFNAIRTKFGFSCDIYDPIFGQGTTLDDGYMFTTAPYPDTFTTWQKLPKGVKPNRYPYISKAQLNPIALAAYIQNSKTDPLCRCLQAIHILNKYNSATHSYSGTNPTNVADLISLQWNGYGIPVPGITGNQVYASGVRTGVYFILVTLLAYKYGISRFKVEADETYKMYNALIKSPQAGLSPFTPIMPGYVINDENGYLYRPQYTGSFYGVWKDDGANMVAVTNTTIIKDMIDSFGLPAEEPGPIVSNMESTAVNLQALRIYAHYALGKDIPNNKFIP